MSSQRADTLKLSGGERREPRRAESNSEHRCPQRMDGVCGENNWREREKEIETGNRERGRESERQGERERERKRVGRERRKRRVREGWERRRWGTE